MDKIGIGNRIEEAREYAKIKRPSFAKKIDPPQTYQTIRAWENGEHTPELRKLFQIATLTKVRLPWLICDSGPMTVSDGEPIPADVLTASLRAMPPDERLRVISEAIGNSDLS